MVLTTRRLLLLLALFSTLVVVLFLALSLDSEGPLPLSHFPAPGFLLTPPAELETAHVPFARGTSNVRPFMPIPDDVKA